MCKQMISNNSFKNKVTCYLLSHPIYIYISDGGTFGLMVIVIENR